MPVNHKYNKKQVPDSGVRDLRKEQILLLKSFDIRAKWVTAYTAVALT